MADISSNILLINDNVEDYHIIIEACKENTYPITYNQTTDTYDSIFEKYQSLLNDPYNNIQTIDHVALVSHATFGNTFTFLENEEKMLLSKYIGSEKETENVPPSTDVSGGEISEPEHLLNNLETWGSFKEFIQKFNIQKSLDFLGCAVLQSNNWKYILSELETEQHLNLNIRASDDDTGNLKVGGDWVLESDNVNIKELYFHDETIEKWKHILEPEWPTTFPETNINFSDLYVALLNSGAVPDPYPPIKISDILNTTLVPSTGNPIPSSGPITIGTHFSGRTFGNPFVFMSGNGGTVTDSGDNRYHKFTSNGTFTLNASSAETLYYLIVGGGGGGGDRHGGGGGGGGVVYGAVNISGSGQSYTIMIGAGGAGGNYETNNSSPRGSGKVGSSSSFSLISTAALGGGGGGTYDGNPYDPCGSGGGGGGRYRSGVYGIYGQGNRGGYGRNPGGGGGGGAGQIGGNANYGYGGAGLQWINGATYAGGGGGAKNTSGGLWNPGGSGGGGHGVWDYTAGAGIANTGGGGGGCRSYTTTTHGADGGSGVVIIRYKYK